MSCSASHTTSQDADTYPRADIHMRDNRDLLVLCTCSIVASWAELSPCEEAIRVYMSELPPSTLS
jgi:hypothetical protein